MDIGCESPGSPAKENQAGARLEQMRAEEHAKCVLSGACRAAHFALPFEAMPDGSVEARVCCTSMVQGYDGIVHGGVIALVLDGAMTNCLFAHGIAALTAEMTVRYRHPVATRLPIVVRGRLLAAVGRFHRAEARLSQDGKEMAVATGKFMAKENGKAEGN